jgi:hypothetical protein
MSSRHLLRVRVGLGLSVRVVVVVRVRVRVRVGGFGVAPPLGRQLGASREVVARLL